MFCKSCGKQIDDDSIFCSYCGTKQTVINNPIVGTASDVSITESKTVNVNLSFGRPQGGKSSVEKIKVSKYDPTYQKETDATVAGVIFLLLSFGFLAFKGINDPTLFALLSIIGLAVRIGCIMWCVSIAKRQNRETFGWGLFAFFLPSISLIIIGLQRKLRLNSTESNMNEQSNGVSHLTNDELSKITLPKLPAPHLTTQDVIGYKTETLIKYLHEYPESIWWNNYPGITPIYIFQELNKRNITIDEKALEKLEDFAKQENYNSLKAMIEHYS